MNFIDESPCIFFSTTNIESQRYKSFHKYFKNNTFAFNLMSNDKLKSKYWNLFVYPLFFLPIFLILLLKIVIKTRFKFKTILIPFPGIFDILFLYPICKLFKKNIVYDSFVNFEQTLVVDRKIINNNTFIKIIRILDLIYLKFSNFVIVETKQIKQHFIDNYSVDENKFFELLSPREIDFKKLIKIELKENTAIYFGSYLPLHGAEFIIKAANLLKDTGINFLFIGDGQDRIKCENLANKFNLSNVEFVEFMEFYSENPRNSLLNYIYSSKISFGSFSTSEKNNQVIPGKIIDALACGKIVITSRTDAVSYYLDGNVVTVEPENEIELADKIKDVFDSDNFSYEENNSIEIYNNLFSFKKFKENLDKVISSI